MLLLALACSSYRPVDGVDGQLLDGDGVTVEDEGRWIHFQPDEPAPIGVVFYPGGRVRHEAYVPPLRLLAEAGYPTALVSMPSDLAVLAPNRADRVIEAYPDVRWVIAGHSLGGAMAARYATDAPVEGLVLWAAYAAEGDDLSGSGLPVLSITATEDEVLDWDTYEERLANLPADTVEVSIEGGNHAGFGDYGAQKGDGTASITPDEQHRAVVDAMRPFLDAIE